ncbi:transcriptional regulator [Sorangium sp. So ce1335]|uniref:transcriptional regulator n=1 Tax=Sorangium sp. So ce1335 TaxID=3133335 RepID=UPI003F5E2061
MTLRRDHALSCTTLLIIACGLAGCGKASTRPAAAPEPAAAPDAAAASLTIRRSADDIILAARLPADTAPRASFEIHRLDAHAACSAAQARLSASVNVNARADAGGGPSALTVSSLVIGGLGLAGGITTTVLAAGLEAPPMPAPGTPSLPDAEPPDIEGKTGVIVAGVLTGVVVVGAVVGTLLLVGGDDDEDEQRKRKLDLDLGGPGARGLRDALRDFELACPDEPAEDALAGCIEKARALRRTCAAR